jgi:hypothetical protein
MTPSGHCAEAERPQDTLHQSCLFQFAGSQRGRPFRPPSDLRAGLAVHVLGPSVGNFFNLLKHLGEEVLEAVTLSMAA